MTLLAINVKQTHGAALELQCRRVDAKLCTALLDKTAQATRLRDARQITLHIGHKAGYTRLGEGLGQHLQGDGLTRTRSAGNQTVAVGHLAYDVNGPR